MQEIYSGIYIESSYIGVTLGAINLAHGLLLIDAPPRPEDVRSWRASLINLGGGVDRLLVNLDAHIDRTLGARSMESTIVAHEKTAQVFRNRPTAFKGQDVETGAEWELCTGLGSIRWSPPEITFSQRLMIHWNEMPVILEHHPGSQPGAVWVILPESSIIFLGDAVMLNQPPFLASADIPAWIESLNTLLLPNYQNYMLVSGRGGLVTIERVRAQIRYLETIQARLDGLAEQKLPPETTESLIPELFSEYQGLNSVRQQLYHQRLRWGLNHYYIRHYRSGAADVTEE
jgi:glyoxylase-like metal-dependent hydrolase (beta-lactamase superfamily II)